MNSFHNHCFLLGAWREEDFSLKQNDCYKPFQGNFHGTSVILYVVPKVCCVDSGRRVGVSHRQRERGRDGDVKSLICNGCVTQMLGVICQPGLSRWAWAALRGKELDTVLSLFTPTHNGGTCKYHPPPHSPPPSSQLRCLAMYLDSG